MDYTRPELLAEPGWLAAHIDDPNVRLIDCGFVEAYRRAHIPGAVHLPVHHYVKEPDPSGGDFGVLVMPPGEFEALMGRLGVGPQTTVVAYDDDSARVATRLWWVLNYYGHTNVKVLNGGFRKWLKESRPVTQDVPTIEKKRFLVKEHPEKVVTREWVQKRLRNKDVVLVDTRSFNEYIGKDLRPGASRGGHLPGAVHLEWTKFSDKVNTFKAAAELEKVLQQRGITRNTKVVTYCGTGLGRSTDMALAMKLIGYDNVVEYTGSWEEWSADPRLPIEK